MKSKLGILSALILSLAIAGSVFAAPGKVSAAKNAPANKVKAVKVQKQKKHHKIKKAKTTKKMKSAMTAPKK